MSLRFNEEDLEEYNRRMSKWQSAPPLPVKIAPELQQAKKQAQKKSLVIVLPFKLPTWNCILAADPWKRKKIRDLIHGLVSIFTPKESDSLTPMEYQQRRQSTALSIAEYYRTITPNTSKVSATAKKNQKKTKP